MLQDIYKYLQIQQEIQDLNNKLYALNTELKNLNLKFIKEVEKRDEFLVPMKETLNSFYLIKLEPNGTPKIKVVDVKSS